MRTFVEKYMRKVFSNEVCPTLESGCSEYYLNCELGNEGKWMCPVAMRKV